MHQPIVSVIVTCFNQESFILEALESINNQSFRNWECIIIDDGSSDKSAVVCQSWIAKDSRFKYIYQHNSGVSAARNLGFKHAQGKYIQFLDGDDFLLPDKLKIQIGLMEDHDDIGVSYTNHFHFWDNTKQFASYDFELLSENPLDQFLYKHDDGVSLPIHAALIRKDIWEKDETPFPFDFPYRYEDWVFWVKICLKKVKFYFLNERLAAYRMHDENFVRDHLSVALNAINATLYISNLISSHSKQSFTEKKITQILLKYEKAFTSKENKKSSIKNRIVQKFKKKISSLYKKQ
jgi:glycosyltransferase involved in cell wall biosynthesis